METFVKWCEGKKLELPPIDENRMRTGVSQNYPPAYVRGQYSELQFPPTKATAVLDLKQKAAKSYGGQKAAD